MKPCFGYVRVSTVKQGDGVSLEAQRDAILRYASRNSIEIISWFEEKETAAKAGRPVFSAMLKKLRANAAAGVVLHKVDRGARNLADWAKFAELADAGIDVHFATETLDFRSRGGRLTADIQAVIAADYIRNLREETLKGLEGRLNQGIYPFKAPLGYQDNGGGKVKTIDPVKGPLVRRMFELYASGEHSLRSLPHTMVRIGLITERDTPYSKCAVEQVLRNPFYTGTIKIRRTGKVYEGKHEPLISQALFDVVQEIKRGRTVKVVTRHRYQFSGLFSCGLCGTAMIAERQKGRVYYRCHTRACETKTVREDFLEVQLQDALARTTFAEDSFADINAASERWYAKAMVADDANTFEMRLKAIEDRLERTTDAYIDRVIDEAMYQNRKERLLREKGLLIQDRDRVRESLTPDDMRAFLELVKNLALHYETAFPDEKRQIIRLATSNRTVSGRNVYVEPADWLVATAEATSGLCCAQSRTTSRTPPDESCIEKLASIAKANHEVLATLAKSREIGR